MKFSAEYQAALDYLYQFVDFSMTKGQVFTPETFDLSRMRALLTALNDPQGAYPVIHIAGSKGKGSTAAMIASVLQASGYRVGLYTSPHMIDFNERIQIDGLPIPHAAFVSLVQDHKTVIESVEKITTFEVATALAFQYFKQQEIDIAVVEVGLGGRLDATNLVSPLLTIITSISMDHTAILGDTLEKIATEKAGILKADVPVILAHQQAGVLAHLSQLAKMKGSPAYAVDELVQAELVRADLDGQEIQFDLDERMPGADRINHQQPVCMRIPLVGKHQMENASNALLALSWLMSHGLHITPESLRDGFERTNWPGRFEILRKEPWLIIDSAHNPDSAIRLAQTLDDLLMGKGIQMIYGASEDKDVRGMLSVFRGRIKHFIFTESEHPRAMRIDQLAEIGRSLELDFETEAPIEQLVSRLCRDMAKDDVVLATGSVFIAAAVKEVYLDRCLTHETHRNP